MLHYIGILKTLLNIYDEACFKAKSRQLFPENGCIIDAWHGLKYATALFTTKQTCLLTYDAFFSGTTLVISAVFYVNRYIKMSHSIFCPTLKKNFFVLLAFFILILQETFFNHFHLKNKTLGQPPFGVNGV